MNVKYILDASALLALLNNEKCSEVVSKNLSFSAISTINLAEVATVLSKLGMPKNEIELLFKELDIHTLVYDRETAIETGAIRNLTIKQGLSLGDRACLITAKKQQCTALTADKAWMEIPDKIAKIKLIR